jgi:hypothetical protein
MTTPVELGQISPLEKLLADLDACRKDKQDIPAGLREETLERLEARLSVAAPLAEGDVFTLMGCLNDKALAPATREGIAGNLAKAAPYTALRALRVQEWISAREASVANSRQEQKTADKSLNRAIDLITVVQAAVHASGTSSLASSLNHVLGDALNELANVQMVLAWSDSLLDQPLPLLNDLWARDQTEAQLFNEVQIATVQ